MFCLFSFGVFAQEIADIDVIKINKQLDEGTSVRRFFKEKKLFQKISNSALQLLNNHDIMFSVLFFTYNRKGNTMKQNFFILALHWFICTIVSYIFVFLLVFYGNRTIIETFDTIFLKLTISIILGTIVWLIYEKCRQKK